MLVDDNPDDRVLALRELTREFPGIRAEQVVDSPGFASALSTGGFDLVITDYQLGWSDGLSVLREVKNRYPRCPVVMLTGSGNEEVAVAAMKGGVGEYMLKSPRHLSRLGAVAKSVLEPKPDHEPQSALPEFRLQGLLHRLRVGVVRTSQEGRILTANIAFLHLLGISSIDPQGQSCLRDYYLRPRDHDDMLEQIRRNGSVREYEAPLRRADGKVIWVSMAMDRVPGPDGEILEGVCTDIGNAKRAELRPEGDSGRLKNLVDRAPMLMFGLSPEGRLTQAEGQGWRTLGILPEEITNRPFGEVFGKKPSLEANFLRAMAGEEFDAVQEFGGMVLEIHFKPSLGPQGQLEEAVAAAVVIPSRQRGEEIDRAFLDSMREKAVFTYHKQAEFLTLNGKILASKVPAKIMRNILCGYVREGKTHFRFLDFKRNLEIAANRKHPNFEIRFNRLARRLSTHFPRLRIDKTGRGEFALRADCKVEYSEEV